MNKKSLRIMVIIFGVTLLLFIIVYPAAPLWAKLGFKPVCIQGEGSHLRIVYCPSTQVAVTPMPLPSISAAGPIPIIVDDDGSPDGTIALLFFLSNPRFDVQAVTISPGEAHPGIFAGHIQKLLADLGRMDIPVGAGRETPLDGNNAFPDEWRQASDNFWGISLPEVTVDTKPAQAADLIIDTIKGSNQPVLIYVSGTHTNLAEALSIDPDITGNIRDVYIMGGSIYQPGNINHDWPAFDNKVAEWNIWVDPVAADDVFSSGLPLHLIPLDATRKVMWYASDLASWQAFNTPEGRMAAKILNWMLETWSADGVYVWDLVAAAQATNPALCTEVSLAIDIIVESGEEQGRTVAGEGKPNAGVCLEPNAPQVKALAEFILAGK
jgi:inosine-uridine nucleoside N-ribohydrolase